MYSSFKRFHKTTQKPNRNGKITTNCCEDNNNYMHRLTKGLFNLSTTNKSTWVSKEFHRDIAIGIRLSKALCKKGQNGLAINCVKFWTFCAALLGSLVLDAHARSWDRICYSLSSQPKYSRFQWKWSTSSKAFASPCKSWWVPKTVSVREKTVEILAFSKSIAFYGHHGSKSVWYYLRLHASNQNTTS